MKKPNILIVEDEILIRLYMVQLLNEININGIFQASTGEQAIDISNNQNIDLILMDIKLAGRLNGYETSQIIQEQKNIPVIIMSAYNFEDIIRDNNKPANIISYYNKPIDPDKISRMINDYYSNFSMV